MHFNIAHNYERFYLLSPRRYKKRPDNKIFDTTNRSTDRIFRSLYQNDAGNGLTAHRAVFSEIQTTARKRERKATVRFDSYAAAGYRPFLSLCKGEIFMVQ